MREPTPAALVGVIIGVAGAGLLGAGLLYTAVHMLAPAVDAALQFMQSLTEPEFGMSFIAVGGILFVAGWLLYRTAPPMQSPTSELLAGDNDA